MTTPKSKSAAKAARSGAAKPAKPARPAKSAKPTSKSDRTYDAIVVGGGHNGLVNGAYLAKSGLKTLIIERRHLVGGAAITEELRPGFWFTTFSYALSLLRPDIIHDLELTKHGFMPLLMSSTFAPDGERRLPAVRPGPRPEPEGDRAPLEARCRRLRPVQPRHGDGLPGHQAAARHGPAGHLQRRSGGAAGAGRDRLAVQEARQAGAPQRDPAADRQRGGLPRRLLRIGPAQGLPRVIEHHRDEGRAALAGLRARAALPLDRGARRRVRLVGLPQGGQRRVHPGPRAGGRCRSARRSCSNRRSIRSSRRTAGRPAWPSRTAPSSTPTRSSARSTRAGPSSNWSNPRELPDDLVENIQRFRFQGTSSKVNFALDGLPNYPALGDRSDHLPRLHEHRAVDGLPRARLRRREVRLVQPAPVHRHGDPVDDRRRHGASRQARHELLHPVHALQAARERLGHREGEPRRHRPARRSSRSSRASATSCSSARSSRRSHIERTVGLSEGNIFAGEFFAPQMFFFRPAPGWSQYRTPIDGYYQCGSGTHPGGCVMGAPGKLAASQILKDRSKVSGRG